MAFLRIPLLRQSLSLRLAAIFISLAGAICHAAGPNAALLAEQEKRAEVLYNKAQRLSASADLADALEKYEQIIKHYPRSSWAAKAQWEIARLYDDNHEYAGAFDAYQLLVEHFPGHFEKALEAQFRLALKVIGYYDQLLRKPDAQRPRELPEKEQASSMLRIIIKNGPYAAIAAEAHYYRGVALEKEGKPAEAREQHELVMEKFPEHALADDASYQVGYIEYKSWKKMLSAAPQQRDRADVALRDFLLRYPQSDKAAQARTLLTNVQEGQRKELLELAEEELPLGLHGNDGGAGGGGSSVIGGVISSSRRAVAASSSFCAASIFALR
jgi:TolA-binding protein